MKKCKLLANEQITFLIYSVYNQIAKLTLTKLNALIINTLQQMNHKKTLYLKQ